MGLKGHLGGGFFFSGGCGFPSCLGALYLALHLSSSVDSARPLGPSSSPAGGIVHGGSSSRWSPVVAGGAAPGRGPVGRADMEISPPRPVGHVKLQVPLEEVVDLSAV